MVTVDPTLECFAAKCKALTAAATYKFMIMEASNVKLAKIKKRKKKKAKIPIIPSKCTATKKKVSTIMSN